MKRWLKRVLFLLLGTVLLLGGGYAAYKGYCHVRQVRLVNQARDYLDKSQERQALLCLRRALTINSRDIAAARLMAQIAEKPPPSPAALLWRTRVVELNPDSRDDRLALAKTALLCHDLRAATNALEGVDAVGKETWAYHSLAGTVAASANMAAKAEAHFAEAVRLEPGNLVSQLNLAVVRLQSTNSQTLASARTLLKSISENPTDSSLRCQAFRELVWDRVRQQDSAAALLLAEQLLQETNAAFHDKILRLELLQRSRNPELKSALAACRKEAATDAAKIVELAAWELANASPAETLVFLKSLAPDIRTNASVVLTTVECCDLLKDWIGVQNLLQQQDWGDLEFLRHAYMAHAQRGQDLVTTSKAEWELALKTAASQQAGLAMLLRLSTQWRWASETEEILWIIVNNYPDAKWAVRALTQTLHSGGRTRPLMMLFSQELKRSPKDLSLKNNLAVSAMLLDAQELKPHELAREVYQAQPSNPNFASTYAFSLYLQDKKTEALKIMQSLSPKDLESPVIAGYYGLILQANGDTQKARTYLNLASNAPVLPEERHLFNQARAGI